jgi:hypothetical protein
MGATSAPTTAVGALGWRLVEPRHEWLGILE